MRSTTQHWFAALPLVALIALPVPAARAGDAESAAVPTYELTAREKEQAKAIADAELQRDAIAPAAKPVVTHFVGAELFRDKAVPARLARVIYYRPAGDLTLYVIVNLATARVVRTDQAAHVPTPLSTAEFESARTLALADPAVKAALGDLAAKVVVEPMQLRSIVPGSPEYGRRIVRLLFRVDSDYLAEPVVIVDITAGTVQIVPSEPWKVGK